MFLCVKESFRYKSERFIKKTPVIKIPCLESKEGLNTYLCPVQALKTWIDRTKQWPNPENFLWLNAATKHPANARILALRFKALITLAHKDESHSNFHQLRKVAASLAFDRGLSLSRVVL